MNPFSLEDISLYAVCKLDDIPDYNDVLPYFLAERYEGYKEWLEEPALITMRIEFKKVLTSFKIEELKEKMPELKIFEQEMHTCTYSIGTKMTIGVPSGEYFNAAFVHYSCDVHISETDILCYMQQMTSTELTSYDIDKVLAFVEIPIPYDNNFYDMVYCFEGKIRDMYNAIEVVKKTTYCSDKDFCRDIFTPSGVLIFGLKRLAGGC